MQEGWRTCDDGARKALRNGSLAHTGVSQKDRVVLGAPRQHLHHAGHLLAPPNDLPHTAPIYIPCACPSYLPARPLLFASACKQLLCSCEESLLKKVFRGMCGIRQKPERPCRAVLQSAPHRCSCRAPAGTGPGSSPPEPCWCSACQTPSARATVPLR